MITLHGFPFSNYYNVVKHVLMHKNLPFEEDLIYGGGEEWLEISPVGKIPALTTEQGQRLSESAVISEYLEDAYPEPALLPADPWERGRVRQICKVAELYLELPCRRLIPFSFTGTAPPQELTAEVREVIVRGTGALARICSFDPFIAGEVETLADIYVRYVNHVVKMVGNPLLEMDILSEVPGMVDWDERMAATDIARRIDAEQAANAEPFFAYLRERFGG